MKLIADSFSGVCWECTLKNQGSTDVKEPCKRAFNLVRALVNVHGRYIPIDAWKCEECGTLVPFETMNRYQMTKEIVITQPRRKEAK